MSQLPMHDFATRIFRRIPIILIVGAIVAISAVILQANTPLSYRAEASYVVGPLNTSPNADTEAPITFTSSDASLNRQLVETYVDLIESQAVANLVAERLDLNPEDLYGKVDAHKRSDSLVIPVTASASTPEEAIAIVNTAIDVTLEEAVRIMKIDHLSRIDTAEIAEQRSPTKLYAGVLGGLAGILLSTLIVSFIPTKSEKKQTLSAE